MRKSFYSNGKLLLTGEYLVLDGGLGLALPTRYGQSLSVTETNTSKLEWRSLDINEKIWFHTTFELDPLKPTVESTRFSAGENDNAIIETLSKILAEAKKLNPGFLRGEQGFVVETKLDFPRDWGLGSSSTLINNIAQWAMVNAYELLWNSFSGSGYDIACAQHDRPILYQLDKEVPRVEEIDFNPPFGDSLYFVHLNKKQSSREAITKYKAIHFDKGDIIDKTSEITRSLIYCTDLSDFEALLQEHEKLLSDTLHIPTAKESLFPDYAGSVKSLGAWGGDFILATGTVEAPVYFKEKGFETAIRYLDMVL
ncbi:MAG: GYDIA family GHMP kinase [Bacteroidota bacterium]